MSLAMWAAVTTHETSKIHFGCLLAETYDDWVSVVHQALDLTLRTMSENPELRKERKEDEITIEVVGNLRKYPIEVEHDAKVGGHTDFLVRGENGYAWLAEAKKYTSNSWIHQGYQQLTTRYGNPTPVSNRGAIIIYSYDDRLDRTMDSWRDYLSAKEPSATCAAIGPDRISFASSQAHARNGMPYEIRHVGLSLYFDPKK